MRRTLKTAFAVTTLFAVGTVPAQAQNYKFDIGVFGGGSWFSTMLSEDHIANSNEDANIKYEAGWLAGGQATFWLSPRLGLRADLAYSERPLQDSDDPFNEGVNLAEDINLWGISGDLMFRFKEPNERWMGREFLPYLALGLGIQRTNPASNVVAGTVDASLEPDAEDGLIFSAGASDFMLADDNTLMGLVGLGGDLRMSPNFALRLEVNDRIFDPQIFALTRTGTPPVFSLTDGDEDVGKVTHWVSGQLGLHLLTGLQRPAQVVVAPPPPAAPAAPAAPAPAERMDALSVCVVDPAAPGGLRTVNALYRTQRRDTVVVAMGDTVAFRTRLPSGITLAPSATWYVQGQPLAFEFETAPRRAEFLTVGTSRVVPASDLVYLGRSGGVPVYAARGDVSAVATQWTSALDASSDDDLTVILNDRQPLRTAFNDVEVLYVPVQPYGCVFQAVQRQEEVRKGGK